MQKKLFIETEIEVVKFNATDVICTSNPGGDGGGGGGGNGGGGGDFLLNYWDQLG